MRYIDIIKANLGGELGRRGLTRPKAAAGIGIKPSTLHAKLNGDRRITLEELIALAAWLNIPISRLLEGIDEADELKPDGEREVAAA